MEWHLHLPLLRTAVCTAAVLASPASARAQSDSERAVARDLFHEGDELQRAGRYPDALATFERAQKLVSAPTNLVRIAQCDVALDHLLEAAETYRAAIRVPLPPDAPTALSHAQDQAREELAQLEPRVPKVTLAITPPNAAGLQIHIDGRPLNVAAVGQPVPLDPGPHVIAISAGTASAERHVDLQERDVKRVTVVLDERAELHGSPSPSPPYLALGLGAAGVVGVILGSRSWRDATSDAQAADASSGEMPSRPLLDALYSLTRCLRTVT
jgi:tetratricopeptide (TPR) repeat protein